MPVYISTIACMGVACLYATIHLEPQRVRVLSAILVCPPASSCIVFYDTAYLSKLHTRLNSIIFER